MNNLSLRTGKPIRSRMASTSGSSVGNGELCIGSFQCKSGCCQRDTGLSLARCANKNAEGNACSNHLLYNIYYKCPCEDGLKCDGDKSIIGSITNTNFGTCKDPNSIA
ncbi:colipase-like isoform X1 [Narcine bancroftii]|uniref:colipase-like isoform X1 n=1 Tax=Narcine bancroftii TaxID=1343680 RepID=UPI0038315726